MNTKAVVDYLNALLAIELFASDSYPQFADQTSDAEIRSTLLEFGRDSERHRMIVAELIAELGERPNTLKQMAAMTSAWGGGLAATSRNGTFGDFQSLQDLLYTEYRDRYHWYVLREIAQANADARLTAAVESVLPDEEKHVAYLEAKARELARVSLG